MNRDLRIPSPIIMGEKRPEIRLQLTDQGQLHYCINNRNLFVPASHLDQDGTYPLSSFLLQRAQPFHMNENQTVPVCSRCTHEPCPMIVKNSSRKTVKQDLEFGGYQELVLSSNIDFWDRPRFDSCPAIHSLLELCQTDFERKFLRLYYEMALGGWAEPRDGVFIWENLVESRSAELNHWFHGQQTLPSSHRDPRYVSLAILRGLKAPVLLPQVWVNYEFGTEKGSYDPQLPGRVDFAFFYRGEKHAVEIDGPSHYARWNGNNSRYEVDEETYTATLEKARNLRQLGWQVHRFSNLEVEQARAEAQTVSGTISIPPSRFIDTIAFEFFGNNVQNYPQSHFDLLPPESS